MAKKEKNPLSEFWTLLKQTPEYNEAYKDAIKTSWIMKYSNGQTSSLNDLYNAYSSAYRRMIEEMRAEVKGVADRNQQQRRYLLRAIYKYCENNGQVCDTQKAIKIACKACRVTKLNEATEQQLIAAIKHFNSTNNRAWADKILSEITT